jgi:hypothetical protein
MTSRSYLFLGATPFTTHLCLWMSSSQMQRSVLEPLGPHVLFFWVPPSCVNCTVHYKESVQTPQVGAGMFLCAWLYESVELHVGRSPS